MTDKIEIWIAQDGDGECCLYQDKPMWDSKNKQHYPQDSESGFIEIKQYNLLNKRRLAKCCVILKETDKIQPKLELKLNPDFKKYQPTEEDREEEINEMKDSIIGSEGDR